MSIPPVFKLFLVWFEDSRFRVVVGALKEDGDETEEVMAEADTKLALFNVPLLPLFMLLFELLILVIFGLEIYVG